MRSSGHSVGKQREAGCDQANREKRDPCCGQKILYIVGIGPGNPDQLSGRAMDVLKSVDTVAGYTTYIDLIKPLVSDKKIISTSMKKEVERVEAAIDAALSGKTCAIISSGDPGVYAMAGLVFELCKIKEIPILPLSAKNKGESLDRETLYIEVVPGIPALCAGASLLGAPLTHDFAAISLSDLLTPWELIETRLEAAARADFVIVIYNPKSKKRDWQIEKARNIILQYRSKETPVGIVTSAMRDDERIQMTTLGELHMAYVDMQTTVFIGNSTTLCYRGFMITPRGYSGKYDIKKEKEQ